MRETIGEKIGTLRKSKNITQAQLAEYLFLVPQTISKWESGNGTPDISLLPKIADFFGIGLDDLFGRSSLEYAKDLVLKYSVLRDDHYFREALDCLQSQLNTVDSSLRLKIGDPKALEQERIELEAYKMHLLLQQSRESAQRALAIAEEVSQKTGDMRFRLQRVQLHIQLGHVPFILSECRAQYWADPTGDTLQLYFEALSILGHNETILKLFADDPSIQTIMNPPHEKNAPLWLQCALAAAATEDIQRTEFFEVSICQCHCKKTEYFFLWHLANLYVQKGQREKCDALKPRLIALLLEVDKNPYYAAQHRQFIDQL